MSSSSVITHQAAARADVANAPVVIVGLGTIGTRHLDVLTRSGCVQTLAISCRSARAHALRRGGTATAADVREAARAGARRCIVASGTGRHAADALAAIEEGMDVLVEKPLAVDAATARQVCKRAQALGRQVFVGCTLRFSESLTTARGLLLRLGPLHAVRIECRSYLPDWRPARPYQASYSSRANEGGVLRDLIHEIDYAGWLFDWPTMVEASVHNLGRLSIEAEEAAELLWERTDGATVSIGLDYLSRPPVRRLQAMGEAGTLEWDGMTGTVTLQTMNQQGQVFHSQQTSEEMLLAQDLAFLQACQGSPDTRLATGEDGVRALAVCDAARAASHSRREERVDS